MQAPHTTPTRKRVVDKRRIRAMRHDAGVRYFACTPLLIVTGAGIGAALFLAVRMLLMKGSAR
jgi:hypothetical protein